MANYIIPIISGCALAISIISIIYTFIQNRRVFNVNLNLDIDEIPKFQLIAYNSGYRPITLKNFRFLANGKELKIVKKLHDVDRDKYPKGPARYYASVNRENFEPPQVLKEGETSLCWINSVPLALYLHYHDYKGKVKISGYFETVKRQRKYTDSIDFDIDEYEERF